MGFMMAGVGLDVEVRLDAKNLLDMKGLREGLGTREERFQRERMRLTGESGLVPNLIIS